MVTVAFGAPPPPRHLVAHPTHVHMQSRMHLAVCMHANSAGWIPSGTAIPASCRHRPGAPVQSHDEGRGLEQRGRIHEHRLIDRHVYIYIPIHTTLA